MNRLIREFGEKSPEVRDRMAKAAKRAIDKGDDSVYHNAYKSLARAGASKEVMKDFGDRFEKEGLNDQPANNLANNESRIMKGQVKLTEEQLHQVIRESVNRVLNEVFASNQVGQYQLGRLAQRKKLQGDDEGYRNVTNHAKLQWGADNGKGSNHQAFANGFHIGKDNVKHGYDMAKRGEL